MKKEAPDMLVRLISDKSFKDWVMFPNEENSLYWRKKLELQPEYAMVVAQAREIVLRMKFNEHKLSSSETDELLTQIISANDLGKTLPKRSTTVREFFSKVKPVFKYAAALAIIALSIYIVRYIKEDVNQYLKPSKIITFAKENPKIQKSRFPLPDGSIVSLNAMSSIDYVFDPQKGIREVNLIGEAFFEVKKNDKFPFVVRSGGISTRAVGTSFNVRYFPEEAKVKVALLNGKVALDAETVSLQDNNKMLKPGEKLVFDKITGVNDKVTFDPLDELAWKDGVLTFQNADFDEFIRRLEHWYGVKFLIVGKPTEKWNVNGRFKTESLEEILVGVKFTYDIEYQLNGDNVKLKLN